MNVRHAPVSSDSDDVRPGAGFRYSPALIPFALLLTDLLVMAVMLVPCIFFFLESGSLQREHLTFTVIFIVAVFIFACRYCGFHRIDLLFRRNESADFVLTAMFVSFSFYMSVILSFVTPDQIPIAFAGAWCVASAVGVILTRIVIARVLIVLSRRRIVGRSVAVLGFGEQCERFLRSITANRPAFSSLVGVYDLSHEGAGRTVGGDAAVSGGFENLLRAIRRQEVDDVVVAMPWNAVTNVTDVVDRLKELPVNVYLSTDLVGYELAFRPVAGELHQAPVFEVLQRPISGWGAVVKAIEDYVIASLAVVLLSPLLLLVAIAIKIDSPGPVFFMQRRLGFNNKEFLIYKFRSMRHRAEDERIVRQAQRGDPRVTRVGRIIRATSLDELPQLFNVLNGTMSLVGPRPHALSHNEEYGQRIRGYFARHRVKPGVTGWAQVNGLRGETIELEKMEDRVRHDVYYAENWSLLFDLRILVMTALLVLFQKTAY
jgi:Undecaprenyl-phosphate glucose phosphotransferase